MEIRSQLPDRCRRPLPCGDPREVESTTPCGEPGVARSIELGSRPGSHDSNSRFAATSVAFPTRSASLLAEATVTQDQAEPGKKGSLKAPVDHGSPAVATAEALVSGRPDGLDRPDLLWLRSGTGLGQGRERIGCYLNSSPSHQFASQGQRDLLA